MTKPIVTIYDIDSENPVVREMTDQEYAQYQIDQENSEQFHNELAARQTARQSAISKLSALGLTESEIDALIGGV